MFTLQCSNNNNEAYECVDYIWFGFYQFTGGHRTHTRQWQKNARECCIVHISVSLSMVGFSHCSAECAEHRIADSTVWSTAFSPPSTHFRNRNFCSLTLTHTHTGKYRVAPARPPRHGEPWRSGCLVAQIAHYSCASALVVGAHSSRNGSRLYRGLRSETKQRTRMRDPRSEPVRGHYAAIFVYTYMLCPCVRRFSLCHSRCCTAVVVGLIGEGRKNKYIHCSYNIYRTLVSL